MWIKSARIEAGSEIPGGGSATVVKLQSGLALPFLDFG